MSTRHYKINPINGNAAKPRLVVASNPAQALRHVAQDSFAVSVATTADVVALMKAGVQEETAGAEPQNPSS